MTQRLSSALCAALLLASPGCHKPHKDKSAAGGARPTPAAPGDAGTTAAGSDAAPSVTPATLAQKLTFYQACNTALNDRDWDKVTACYAEDATGHLVDLAPSPLAGRDAILTRSLRPMTAGIPDVRVQPQIVLASGDKLASLEVVSGTQKGVLNTPIGEFPPSGKKVSMLAIHVAQLAPGRLAVKTDWIFMDMATLMGQVGMSKAPHRKKFDTISAQPVVAMAKGGDSEKGNIAAYRRMTDAFNKHDAHAVKATWAPQFVAVDAAAPADQNAAQAAASLNDLFKAFSDVHWQPTDVWSAGDYVVATGELTGTNDGAMAALGMPKTGRKVHVTRAEIVKFENGKAVESWVAYNQAALVGQLGLSRARIGTPLAAGAPMSGAK